MYVERILCPVVTLGPGRRLVIWTKGCSKGCPECISPEMAEIGNAQNVDVQDIFIIIRNIYEKETFDGITISGGDPLEQLPELLLLLDRMRELTDDILVYTGYVWDEYKKILTDTERTKLETCISVLIDGPYIHEKNEKDLTLRGSSNQKIIFFDEGKRESYEAYIKEGRKLQNFYMGNRLLIVGIMDK